MRSKSKTKARLQPASPNDYRRFARESVRRCLAMPANHTRSRAVQIILARAWDKLADQAEEWRRRHRPPAAA
jgi:hypothetical protein